MAPVPLLPSHESSAGSLNPRKHPGPTGLSEESISAQMEPSTCSRPKEVADIPRRTSFEFDSMEDALAAFAKGEFLVVMDDESRENEGDLIIAASECSTEKMAWMIKHTRYADLQHPRFVLSMIGLITICSGYICTALPGERLEELEIPMMVNDNQDPHRTAYAVTVDYRQGTHTVQVLTYNVKHSSHGKLFLGTTTGISAHDRALTARALASTVSNPGSFSRPGHMVPLRARPGGVLTRRGHTEAAVDLCTLAGLPRAGILCELVEDNEEGSMMRRDACRKFADRWGLKMISVDMLVRWRSRQSDI